MSKTISSFTISSIKTDRNGHPYINLFAKDGGALVKVDGMGAMNILASVIGDDGNPVAQGDLIAIAHDGIRDASWTTESGERIAQFRLVGMGSTRIIARKGSGVKVTAPNGQQMTAHRGIRA